MTKTVLHAGADSPVSYTDGAFGPDGTRYRLNHARRCPECCKAVDTSGANWRKMFCSEPHRVAFHNRQTVRGRVLTSIVMAERITRSGDCRDKGAGKLARRLSRKLMDKWIKEDREAGRMAADEYFSIRQQLGFNDQI